MPKDSQGTPSDLQLPSASCEPQQQSAMPFVSNQHHGGSFLYEILVPFSDLASITQNLMLFLSR
ncbi:MAG: hypothetical protein ACKPKO_65600, partial [Candidatus Fonsibacter sp.]